MLISSIQSPYFIISSSNPPTMASDSEREAAAATFFAHMIRATLSAATAAAAGIGGEADSQIYPTFFGLLGPPSDDGEMTSPPNRILLVDPVFHRVAVLHGDPALLSEMLSAGLGSKGPPPASKASIEAMLKVESVLDGEECAICLDEFVKGEPGKATVKEMPCRHRFHGDCVEKWLVLHGTCPVCRHAMPAEEVTAKKADGGPLAEGVEWAVWVEIAFGRGAAGDRDREQEQQPDEQSAVE